MVTSAPSSLLCVTDSYQRRRGDSSRNCYPGVPNESAACDRHCVPFPINILCIGADACAETGKID
jgi:hypothetical protein